MKNSELLASLQGRDVSDMHHTRVREVLAAELVADKIVRCKVCKRSEVALGQTVGTYRCLRDCRNELVSANFFCAEGERA